MLAHLLVADSQDAALRVELAVLTTDGDTHMFYFQRSGSDILQRERCEELCEELRGVKVTASKRVQYI
jgi:hypothetical protein